MCGTLYHYSYIFTFNLVSEAHCHIAFVFEYAGQFSIENILGGD